MFRKRLIGPSHNIPPREQKIKYKNERYLQVIPFYECQQAAYEQQHTNTIENALEQHEIFKIAAG